MKFHHVGMVVRSVSVAENLCRERLKDNEPLVWGPVPAFQCGVAFSTRFPMIEFVVPEPESRLVKFLEGKSVLHHIAFAVEDVRNPVPFSPSYSMNQRTPPSRGSWSTFSNPSRDSSSNWCRIQEIRLDCLPDFEA